MKIPRVRGRVSCLIGMLSVVLGISPLSAKAQTADWSKAHPDSIMNYICWDGSLWTAKIQAGQFLHAPNNDYSSALTHPDTIINYKTWDGSNWTARLSGTTFIHAPNGDFSSPLTHPDSIINYRTWDGSWWTAKIQPDFTFLHAPVAGTPAGAPGGYAAPHPGPPHPPAIPPNVVEVVANQNSYFGGTEDPHQAAAGAFGTVYINKGQHYQWHLSGSGKMLYWGAFAAVGGPMPPMHQRGTVVGGNTLFVP